MTDRLARYAEMRKYMPRGQVTIGGLVQAIEPAVATIAIFLVPIRFLRSPVGLFTLSDLFLLASLVLLLMGRRFPLVPLGKLTWLWFSGFALIIGGLLISSLMAGSLVRGFNVISQYFFTLAVVPFVIFGRDRQMTLRLVKALVISLVLVEAFGIFCYATGWNPTGRMISGSKRLMSLMEEANSNGCIVAMAIPLTLYLWQARHFSNLIALGLILPLFVVALVLTSSVTGLMAAMVGAFVFVLATFNPKVFSRAVLILAGLVIFFGAGGIELFPKTFQKRVLAPLESGDLEAAGTFADRMVLMREALVTIEKNPVIGVGGDEFRRLSTDRQPVHNIYLLLWAEGGLLSVIGWVLILIVGGVAAFEAYMTRQYRLTGAVAFSLTASIAFIGLNTPHMYGRYWVIPFFLATALAINATSRIVPVVKVKSHRRL